MCVYALPGAILLQNCEEDQKQCCYFTVYVQSYPMHMIIYFASIYFLSQVIVNWNRCYLRTEQTT